MKLNGLFLLFAWISVALARKLRPADAGARPMTTGSFHWTSCGTSSDHFHVSQVFFSPDPAVPGQNTTTKAVGYQDETVTGGTWQTKIYLDDFPVHTVSGNVCDLVPNCACPCPAGNYTTVQSLYVPSYSPPGTYTGQYTAVDQNNQPLVCINFSFEMS